MEGRGRYIRAPYESIGNTNARVKVSRFWRRSGRWSDLCYAARCCGRNYRCMFNGIDDSVHNAKL